jgi:hypothetical protein
MMINKIQVATILGFISLSFGVSNPVFSQERMIDVSFKNNSNNTMKCQSLGMSGYTTFLSLEGKQQKTFSEFVPNIKARCYTVLTPGSTTVLTYFKVSSAGTYELMLEKVSCRSCTQTTWRWATVVVNPNGQPDYNRLGQE